MFQFLSRCLECAMSKIDQKKKKKKICAYEALAFQRNFFQIHVNDSIKFFPQRGALLGRGIDKVGELQRIWTSGFSLSGSGQKGDEWQLNSASLILFVLRPLIFKENGKKVYFKSKTYNQANFISKNYLFPLSNLCFSGVNLIHLQSVSQHIMLVVYSMALPR